MTRLRLRAGVLVAAGLIVAGLVPTALAAPVAAQPVAIATTPPAAGQPVQWDDPEQVALRTRTDDCGRSTGLSDVDRAVICGQGVTGTPAYSDPALMVSDATGAMAHVLADFSVSVSQTSDLRNQLVRVGWDSGLNQRTNVQVMQCWSEGPTVAPDREQCEFGGQSVLSQYEGATGVRVGESRLLGADPEYRPFQDIALGRLDGGPAGIVPGTPVRDWKGREGARPPTSTGDPLFNTWESTTAIQLSLDSLPSGFSTCTAAAGEDTCTYEVLLYPPSGAQLGDGTPLPEFVPLVTQPFTAGADEVPPGEPVFLTTRFSLADGAAAAGVTDDSWPLGRYEFVVRSRSGSATPITYRLGVNRQSIFVDGTFVGAWSGVSGSDIPLLSVPFDPFGEGATRRPTTSTYPLAIQEWINPRATNSIPIAPGTTDGTGVVPFEVFTDLESQGTACGRRSAAAPTCWLVVVPRFARQSDRALDSSDSPLAYSLWDLRVNVRLDFVPVTSECSSTSSDLRQVYVNDTAHTAVQSWQASLCGLPGAAATVSRPQQDFQNRDIVNAPNRMGVVGIPDEGRRSQVGAPVSTGGLAFAFALDQRWADPNGETAAGRNQTRVSAMNLTPRLVAKLLTQSYTSGSLPNGIAGTQNVLTRVPPEGAAYSFTPERNLAAGTPANLLEDKEFLDINPDIAEWVRSWGDQGLPVDVRRNLAGVIYADASSDSYGAMWQWILADPAAKAFLDGTPDDNGVTVNPAHRGTVDDRTNSIRLRDGSCADYLLGNSYENVQPICTANFQSRVESILDTALFASRGDSRRQAEDPLPGCDTRVNPTSCLYRREPRQAIAENDISGVALIALTTTALAERLGLPTAALGTPPAGFVQPTVESLTQARDRMRVRGDGVLLPDPASYGAGAYPLTAMSYAVVDVCRGTSEQRSGFARILDFAAGDGQQQGLEPGQLPPGYAPLSAELRGQATAAAATLRDAGQVAERCPAPAPASAPATPTRTPPPAAPVVPPDVAAPPAAARPTTSARPSTRPPTPRPSPAAAPVVASATPSPSAEPTAGLAATDTTAVATTADTDPRLAWILPLVLGVGIAASAAGPLLALAGRRSSRASAVVPE